MTDIYKKYKRICTPETMTATRLNIEIPINKRIKRNVQQACISNLLVTVFADSPIVTEPNP